MFIKAYLFMFLVISSGFSEVFLEVVKLVDEAFGMGMLSGFSRLKRFECCSAAFLASCGLWTRERTSCARRCCAKRLEGSLLFSFMIVEMSELGMKVKSFR